MKTIDIVAVIALSAVLGACAATGTPGATFDAQRVVDVGCAALPIADAAFKGFAQAFPGKVDATGLSWETGVVKTATAACATKPDVTNIASLASTVTAAVLAVTDYIANNKPVPS